MKLLAFALLVLLLAMPAHGQDYDAGLAAYERGDYAAALKEWKPLAEQGGAAAQYDLGLMYANGQGVPRDYVQAVKWYRRAAEHGHAAAQNNLGFMYDKGWGVPRDYVQAHKWFKLAAAQGNENGRSNSDIVEKQMTSAQIAEAQRMAREWLEKHERQVL